VKKIISLFQRNYDGDRLVRNEVVPGAEWVLAGEGVATRKYDGTCCMVRAGKLYKRYDHKPDNWKKIQRALKAKDYPPEPVWNTLPPVGFERAQEEPDPVTFHWPGWIPVNANNPEDQWHMQAAVNHGYCEDGTLNLPDGTYELCGPKIGGNPEGLEEHSLIPHGFETFADAPRDFEGLKNWLAMHDMEGIVWHHPDGRLVKIKKRDFGLPRTLQ
jgi:hypothetical protein